MFITESSVLIQGQPMASGGGSSSPPSYSTTLETTLRSSLYDGYSVLQRPSQRVTVKVSFNILTINDMDIRDQVMSISGFLSLVSFTNGKTGRLAWSSETNYSNIPFLFSTEEYTWKPAIIIENSVKDISVISDKNIPMRIDSSGHVMWNPSGIYLISCESDITYYPMDTQICTLIVTTWAYTMNEIVLTFQDDPVDLQFYSPNGEWDLVNTSYATGNSKARRGQSFSSIEFTIEIKRRILFHTLNTLFPVSLMAFLIAMVFKLPPESGEKIGFSLTVLLAYAVYLSMISENIPSTSIYICYLAIYLALILALGTISVLCTIVVLNVYFRPDDEEIPTYLNDYIIPCLARLVCHRSCCCCRNKRGKNTSRVEPLKSDEVIDQSTFEETSDMTWQEFAKILDKLFFFLFIRILVLTCFFHTSIGQPPPKPSYSKDLETALRTELFNISNYHVQQRPQKKVEVQVSLTLLTINELNIKDQFLSISGYLSMFITELNLFYPILTLQKWFDSRLAWFNPSLTSQDYSNVPFLFSSETYVWRPAIIVENAIDDMSVISDPNVPMRINNRGMVTWNPAGNLQSVIAWAYTTHEIVLLFDSSPIDLDFYSENGEWEIVATHGDKAGERARGGQSFSNLNFTLTLRRRPLFHILSTLFPVILMAVLISMVFQLPPDSGEKIGFSLTVLLAYAVYLTLISETIPSTSMTVCYLCNHLSCYDIGTWHHLRYMYICTILVLKVHFKTSSSDIPHVLDVLVWKFIVKITCWKHHCCCCKTKVSSSTEVKLFTKVNEKHKLPEEEKSSVIEDTHTANVNELCMEEHTWQEMALILDHFFFVIFISTILISSISILS
ncbi:hypothetical protein KUTeg_013599, partial [Tegillarca granosa]